MRIFSYAAYLFVRLIAFFFQILPESAARRAGGIVGSIAFFLDAKHRNIALSNLKLAFGNARTAAELHAIAKRNFVNLGTNFAVFCRIPRLKKDRLPEMIEFHGQQHLKEALAKGKGALVLLSHLGNWELLITLPLLMDIPIYAVGKPLRNRYLGRWITKMRESFNVRMISSQGAARTMFKLLRKNSVIGILIDQRARRRDAVWINFFGHPAPTLPTPAFFALKTGAAVIPVSHSRMENTDQITFHPAIDIVHAGDIKQDILTNTQNFHAFLEEEIRKDPAQWFWVHRRWARKGKRKRQKNR